MKIGIYLRLSISDGDLNGDKKESNSIDNQRILLREYIDSKEDLIGEVVEYVDDGYTGMNFNRPGFKRMIEDARKGKIKVILAKDLSRLGRNYIDLGDYLDQIFPRIGVRVIAVNSGYDSNDHKGDVSGIDAAITNFINTMYVKDLSVKIKSSYRSRWSRSVFTQGSAPFGYIHDKAHKERWLIDKTAAKVVQDIFEWAAEGKRIMEIVDILNDMHLETPSAYMNRVYKYNYAVKVTDKERLWDYRMVRKILRAEEYTGDSFAHKMESLMFDNKRAKRIPKENWVRIKDHHPPLVSRDLYEKAQRNSMKIKWTDKREPAIFSLKSKLRCGNCHLMFRYIKNDKAFCCPHKEHAGSHSQCSDQIYSYPHTEELVFEALKKYLRDMQALEFIINTNVGNHRDKAKMDAKYHESRIEILKAERIRQYEGYAAGTISSEAYQKKKKSLSAEIDEHKAALDQLESEISEDNEVLMTVRDSCDAALVITEEEKLTKKMVDCFIRDVYVYDGDRIELVFITEDIIAKAIRRSNYLLEKEIKEQELYMNVEEGG